MLRRKHPSVGLPHRRSVETSRDPTHIRVDDRNVALDLRFVRRLWTILKPYWVRPGVWTSCLLAAASLTGAATYGIFGGFVTNLTRDQTNALVSRNNPLFWTAFVALLFFGVLRQAVYNAQSFAGRYLELHWRRWLTSYLVDRYLARRTYYDISQTQEIDNPDQRIQEQVAPFCRAVSDFPSQLTLAGVDVTVQVVILAKISQGLLAGVLGYVAFQIVLNYYLYRPTIRLQWESTMAEADLRYGLLHVRDNAEIIAFYRGEKAEQEHLYLRLVTAVKKQLRILVYSLRIDAAVQCSGIIWQTLPMIFLVPLFMGGTIDFGAIGAAIASASMIVASLGVFSQFIPTLTAAAPNVVRLAEIQEKFEDLAAKHDEGFERIDLRYRRNGQLVLRNVSLQTPGGERNLIENLSLHIDDGHRLLIVGQTGVGKSSLLRAMAGLWTRGNGTIELPDPSEMMFLPQKPYMLLANLRSQILYPAADDGSRTDEELQAILERVSLTDLAARVGGFDARRDWTRLLSLGEQQRLSFARILVSKPRYVFLDEATSALDNDTESSLYALLRETGLTFISVAHRQSVFVYHDKVLELRADGWTYNGATDKRSGLVAATDRIDVALET